MRTVIVGHGRSPEQKGWGPRIDAADCVVRMWDWQWQTPADHGTRYDYGIIETCRAVMRRFLVHNHARPAKGWIASKLVGPVGALPRNTQVVNQRNWLDKEGSVIGGRGVSGLWELTRGSIAACWALERAKSGDEVILLGCDNLKLGVTLPADAAFSEAYQADPAFWGLHDYSAGVTKSGNHDFSAERRLLEHMARNRNATVMFAQDVWTGR